MTENERIALSLLRSFDYAVLRRVAPRVYDVFGHVPDYYNTLFPPDGSRNAPCAAP